MKNLGAEVLHKAVESLRFSGNQSSRELYFLFS